MLYMYIFFSFLSSFFPLTVVGDFEASDFEFHMYHFISVLIYMEFHLLFFSLILKVAFISISQTSFKLCYYKPTHTWYT